MAAYSVFVPRTSAHSAWDDFLPAVQEEEEDEQIAENGQEQQGENMDRKSQADTAANANGHAARGLGLDTETEEERVRDVTLLLLPLLLANPPGLPSHLKSSELTNRHQMLSINPHDVEDYLVTPPPNAGSDVKPRVIAGLDQIRANIEHLAGIMATDTDAMEHSVQSVQWQVPESGLILSSVRLGESPSNEALLNVILKREDQGGRKREPWKFHNVLPADTPFGSWFDKIEGAEGALKLRQQALDIQHPSAAKPSRAPSAATSRATSRTVDSYNTATDGSAHNGEEQEDESQAAEKFSSAEDFWGGYDDDEDDKNARDQVDHSKGERDPDAASDDDDAYWNSYDVADPVADAHRRDEQDAERQKQMDLDTASQIGSVNFDRLERRVGAPPSSPGNSIRPGLRSAVSAAETNSFPIEEEVQGYEDYQGAAKGRGDSMGNATFELINPALESAAPPDAQPPFLGYESVKATLPQTENSLVSRRTGRGSPRSDATSFGGTDEAEPVTTSHTTVDDESNSAKATSTTVGDPSSNRDQMLSPQPTVEDPNMSDEQVQKAVRFGEGAKKSEMLGIGQVAAQQQQARQRQQQQRSYPAPPMSVSAQSTFETPDGMTLAEIEAYYRKQEHERIAETRDKIERMQRERQDRQNSEESDDDDDDGEIGHSRDSSGHRKARDGASTPVDQDTEVERILREAKNAIGGIKNKHRRPSPSNTGAQASQVKDPALDYGAGRTVEQREDEPSSARVPLTRNASMDTLRKLADQNRLRGPGTNEGGPSSKPRVTLAVPSDQITSSSTADGRSRGGKRNFLQLAPSTVATDLDLDEPAINSPVPTPPAIEEEDEEQGHSFDREEPTLGQEAGEEDEQEPQTPRAGGKSPVSADEDEDTQVNDSFDHGGESTEREDQLDGQEDEDAEQEDEHLSEAAEEDGDGSHDEGTAPPTPDESQPTPSDSRDDEDADLEAFLFPGQPKQTRIDSPSFSESNPGAKEGLSAITGRDGSRDDENKLLTPSESFLPGAASDASVRPLLGSTLNRNLSDESSRTGRLSRGASTTNLDLQDLRDGKGQRGLANVTEDDEEASSRHEGASQSKLGGESQEPRTPNRNDRLAAQVASAGFNESSAAINSTNTELGVPEIEAQSERASERQSVRPGPQWVGAAPPPGSTSQRTANLRHQYLRQQRQLALETQRNRILAQRGSSDGRGSHHSQEGSHKGNDDGDGLTPAPLARGAAQRQPFPSPSAPAHDRHRKSDPTSNKGHGRSSNGRGSSSSPMPPEQPPAEISIDSAETQRGSQATSRGKPNRREVPNLSEEQRRTSSSYKNVAPVHRPQMNMRQQNDRQHASAAAARRRELVKLAARRGDHAKTMLKALIKLLNDKGEGQADDSPRMAESEFLRLARDAFRECDRERQEAFAVGPPNGLATSRESRDEPGSPARGATRSTRAPIGKSPLSASPREGDEKEEEEGEGDPDAMDEDNEDPVDAEGVDDGLLDGEEEEAEMDFADDGDEGDEGDEHFGGGKVPDEIDDFGHGGGATSPRPTLELQDGPEGYGEDESLGGGEDLQDEEDQAELASGMRLGEAGLLA